VGQRSLAAAGCSSQDVAFRHLPSPSVSLSVMR
jgi:hypothetical protein